MNDELLRKAWQEKEHAQYFDGRSLLPLDRLRADFERFNEFQLLIQHKTELPRKQMVEVACATGELYRYISNFHPEIKYHGFDISQPAIERARFKYPQGSFTVCGPDLKAVFESGLQPDLLWARDVVHHQPDPFPFLKKILKISNFATLLRLRTRDVGPTVNDPEQSCQYHYGMWVPFIVLNMDEVIGAIRETIKVRRIEIVKRYEILGGTLARYIPKECYYPETGTAETAVYIEHGEPESGDVQIVQRSHDDSKGPDFSNQNEMPLWMKRLRFHWRKLKQRR